jgi:hypothetical protein
MGIANVLFSERETMRHLAALALPLMMALPVRAQDLPYDSVTLTTNDGGSETSIEVSKDGHYKITKPNGREIEGTLTAGEKYAVAASSGRAGFAPDHPASLGKGDGLPFTLEARTGDHSYSVTGNEGSLTLGSFGSLVRTLQSAMTEKMDGFIFRWLFDSPKLPNALELKLTKGYDTTGTLTILDDGKVTYTGADGRTRESTLTAEESSEIAKSVKRVDRSGSMGPAGPITGTKPGFKIVVYETFHQYLLEGEVGSYGANDAVGSLVVTLKGVLDRLGVAVELVTEDASTDKGSLFPRMLDDLARTLRDLRGANVIPPDRGARTTGLAGSIILDREHAATDDAKGDKVGER